MSLDLTKTLILDESFMYHENQDETPEDKSYRKLSTLNDYIIIEELGKGAQGVVYKAKRLSDDKIIALKVLNVRYGSDKYYQAINEVEILEEISEPQCNPYLACYYSHSYDQERKKLLIEMEYRRYYS